MTPSDQEAARIGAQAFDAIAGLWHLLLGIAFLILASTIIRRLKEISKAIAILSKQVYSIDTSATRLELIASKMQPKPLTGSTPGFVSCPCSACGQAIEFDPQDFNPKNPLIINCPHCSAQTQLFIPHSI